MVRNDISIALRQMRKSPGFTLTVILTLALGIGALATVATWINAVLYNPWPAVADSGSVRFIDATVLGNEGYSVRYNAVRFVGDQNHSFSNSLAFAMDTVNLNQPGSGPRSMEIGTVSSNYFQFLGLKPQLGRFFDATANDRAYGSQDAIVLSDLAWRQLFNSDPQVVGRGVSLNRHIFTVIGVGPKGFSGIFGGVAEMLWVPLSALKGLSSDPAPDPLVGYGLQMAVRLRRGVSDAAAAAELHTLARRFAATQANNTRYARWDLNLRDSAHFERGLFGVVEQVLPVLLAASVLLMVLVSINIASLLGQYAARRRREVAIRTALGATPGRMAAQIFTQTALLALAGAIAGWGLSTALSRSLYVLLPNFGVTLAFNLETDAGILAFVAAIATVVTLACGMYPVRQSLRVSQREALHEGGAAVAGPRRRMGRKILFGLQLGICFVVLVCCGLLTRTAINIATRGTGFDPSNVMTAGIDLSRIGYSEERGLALQSALIDKLRSSPEVAGATITSHLPMGDSGSGNTQGITIPGYVPAKGEEMDVVTDFEGPDFFSTLRIPMRAGREFTTNDTASAPGVAVINEAMARRYWPKGDAIGRSITVNKRTWQIVGVVQPYTYYNPDDIDPSPVLYLPLAQNYSGGVFLAVRSRTAADAAGRALRRAVASLDGSLPLEDVKTEEAVAGERYQFARIPAELLGVYAISCLLVAMLGMYAVMAYSVIERHREFALRMALGSTRSAIFRLVLSGSGTTAAIGLILGGLGSIAAVRLVQAMLFGIAAFDPVSYFAAAMFLLITVIISGLAPARRAASIEPMQALRSE